MNEQERKLMLSIAKRLGVIEQELRVIKGKPTAVTVPTVPELVTGSPKANKFFGKEPVKSGVTGSIAFDTNKDPEILAEIKTGQEMLKKAVTEFCNEFDITEFTITFNNPQK